MPSNHVNLLYDTSRLSDIPSMASTISNRIAVFNKQHKKLIDSAVHFFTVHPELVDEFATLKRQYLIGNKRIDLIKDFEKEKGKLPVIKGQTSTEKYLNELYRENHKEKQRMDEIEAQLITLRSKHCQYLELLTDNMLDLLDNEKIFSQFLGTMALSAPLPKEKFRCQFNEKRKPIYVATLAVLLFDEVRRHSEFTTPYIKEYLAEIFANEDEKHLTTPLSALPDVLKIKYREELLKPLAKATIIQAIGSYAPEVEAIFKGDRYKKLNTTAREKLIGLMDQKSLEYLLSGIGIPHRVFNSHEEKTAHLNYEEPKLQFMKSILMNKQQSNTELSDLLRIPLIYSSFILSTKENHKYQDIYEAYHVIEHGGHKAMYSNEFAKLFLKIVGKFPIGSGVYFISKRSGQIEKAIVSSLYPENHFEPICKQITKNQIQSLSQNEIIVKRDTNIYYEDVRVKSVFKPDYFTNRFNDECVWNPNEQWEVQIPAKTFWKKDINRAIVDDA